jgi:NADPH:quinone reductase-like Zn-dependent oxidoreductase
MLDRVVSSSSRTTEKSAATSIQGSAPAAPGTAAGTSEPRRRLTREDHERGLPGHHDPTAGLLGAPPARSALTLRLVPASSGLVVCVVSGVLWLRTELPAWPAVLLFGSGAVALVDLVVAARRKLRGEPGQPPEGIGGSRGSCPTSPPPTGRGTPMRAVVYTQYGEPEVLSVGEVEEPHAGPGQVRISVRAASVNPIDWKQVGGLVAPAPAPPGPTVPGYDAAGVVDEVGEGVTGVRAGDAVFGLGRSTAAEHAVLRAWAPKPPEVSFEVAAGLGVAGETAVRALDLLGLPEGATVVVDGASGGVGIATVRVAVSRGLRVVGTSSAANAEFVRSLGALHTTYGEGLTDRVRALAPGGVDGGIDTAGKGSVRDLVALTGDPARVVTIADFGAGELGVQVTSGNEGAAPRLAEVAGLLAEGRLHVPVAGVYPLEQVAEAYRRSREGHVRGKLVLTV